MDDSKTLEVSTSPSQSHLLSINRIKEEVERIALSLVLDSGKTLGNISVIQGFFEEEIRGKTCSSIGPDNIVIQCNWLLIGHNALNLQPFNYVWRVCPSTNGSSPCELSSSEQLRVALMIFLTVGEEPALKSFCHVSPRAPPLRSLD